MATAFTSKPPPLLEPVISRYDIGGHPTIAQKQWEGLMQQFLLQLAGAVSTLQPKTDASLLPTANPHVVGQVWSNAGILTVSAG
jgi:hypothetical protein